MCLQIIQRLPRGDCISFSTTKRNSLVINRVRILGNGTALFCTKETNQIEPYHLIGSFGCQWAGAGLGTYHQETCRLRWTSCRARRFIGRLGKLFFWRRRRQFHLFGCCSIHVSSEKNSNQHPQCFPSMLLKSKLEARIMQVQEKHKYQPQNLIILHQEGCSCVLKRPPILPMRKDTLHR